AQAKSDMAENQARNASDQRDSAAAERRARVEGGDAYRAEKACQTDTTTTQSDTARAQSETAQAKSDMTASQATSATVLAAAQAHASKSRAASQLSEQKA